ncbi:hypothetical protein NUW58_g2265 [Xylaria curta]|uniref:Uncharacterized protein n=1 Tax=Xylaria curta TaxID=42375 RepID=A0ACC1PGZ9_9PEZI|nr:hypothetical protein NUW58_g2265 [Xylaria curta]
MTTIVAARYEKKRKFTSYSKRPPTSSESRRGGIVPPLKFTDILDFGSKEREHLRNDVPSPQAKFPQPQTALEDDDDDDDDDTKAVNEDLVRLTRERDAAEKRADENEKFKCRFEDAELQINKLREELSSLEATKSDLFRTQLEVKNLSANNSKLLYRILQQENSTRTLKDAEARREKATEELEAIREKLVESTAALQAAEERASTNAHNYQRVTAEKTELQDQFCKAVRTHAMLEKKHNKLAGELEISKEECATIPALRSELTATETNLSSTTEALHKAQEQISGLELQIKGHKRDATALQNRIVECEHEKAALGSENNRLVATSTAAKSKAEEAIEGLHHRIRVAEKDLRGVRLDKSKLEEEVKAIVGERQDLCQRISNLEVAKLDHQTEQNLMLAQLAVAQSEASQLPAVRSELQAAQQQIEIANHHMEACPFVQKSEEFWSHSVEVSSELNALLSKSLVNLRATPKETPAKANTPLYPTPSPPCS